jgi:MFS family permease
MGSLAVPAAVGAVVDRAGARPVVIAAFTAQALGTVAYLLAHHAVTVFVALLAAAIGQRAFWASVFKLLSDIADVEGRSAKEPVFATAAMMQSAGLAIGGAAAGLVMSPGSPGAYRLVVALNAASFAGAGLLIALGVPPRHRAHAAPGPTIGTRQVLADRRFLALLASYTSISLAVGLCTVAGPLYMVDRLHLPTWVPAALLGGITVGTATLRGRAVAAARSRSRITVLTWATIGNAVWLAGMALAPWIPRGLQIAFLMLVTVPYLAAVLVHGPVATALVDALAPATARGRYQAVFQYAFGTTNVLAPAMVGLYAIALPLPWLLGLAASAAALLPLRMLATELPHDVLFRPDAGAVSAKPSGSARRPAFGDAVAQALSGVPVRAVE